MESVRVSVVRLVLVGVVLFWDGSRRRCSDGMDPEVRLKLPRVVHTLGVGTCG